MVQRGATQVLPVKGEGWSRATLGSSWAGTGGHTGGCAQRQQGVTGGLVGPRAVPWQELERQATALE